MNKEETRSPFEAFDLMMEEQRKRGFLITECEGPRFLPTDKERAQAFTTSPLNPLPEVKFKRRKRKPTPPPGVTTFEAFLCVGFFFFSLASVVWAVLDMLGIKL